MLVNFSMSQLRYHNGVKKLIQCKTYKINFIYNMYAVNIIPAYCDASY